MYERVEIQTLASGRKLIFGRITSNANQEHDKSRFLFTCTMHGDEVAEFSLMLRIIHYLLNNYGEEDPVTHPFAVRYSTRAYSEYEEILDYVIEKPGALKAAKVDMHFEEVID